MADIYDVRVMPTFVKGIRFWGAAGCQFMLCGVQILSIPTDDYIVDFERIINNIHRLDQRTQNNFDCGNLKDYTDNFAKINSNHIVIGIRNQLELPRRYDKNAIFPRAPNGPKWNSLDMMRYDHVYLLPPRLPFDWSKVSHSIILKPRF